MEFKDKHMFEVIEKKSGCPALLNKITNACNELKSNTGCPDDDGIDFSNL